MSLVTSLGPTRAVVERLVELGTDGFGPFDSAIDLVEPLLEQYQGDQEQVIAQLIRGESRLGFAGGMATGMGGLMTMPITLPSAVAISWILQARLAAAIAIVYGQDPKEPDNRDQIIAAIIGEDLESDSSSFQELFSIRGLQQLPGAILNSSIEIAKKRIVRRVARSGVKIISPRLLPVLSGAISGRIDRQACIDTGQRAVEIFRNDFALASEPFVQLSASKI